MRQKLRTIVVDGITYRWRFAPGYERTGDPADPYQSHDIFTAYLAEQRTGQVRIHFRTWEDAIVGGPLRTASRLNRTNPESSAVNLHTPKLAAQLIRQARIRGWNPQERTNPFVINDGLALLAEIGYRVE